MLVFVEALDVRHAHIPIESNRPEWNFGDVIRDCAFESHEHVIVLPGLAIALDASRDLGNRVPVLFHERAEERIELFGWMPSPGVVLATLRIAFASDAQCHRPEQRVGLVEEQDPVGHRLFRLAGDGEDGLLANIHRLVAYTFEHVEDDERRKLFFFGSRVRFTLPTELFERGRERAFDQIAGDRRSEDGGQRNSGSADPNVLWLG